MYRDDYAAAQARLETVQRELASAQSQRSHDAQHIAALTAQLQAAQAALARLGGQVQQYQYQGYALPSRAGTILALGILSLVVCSFLGPIAWSMGNEELRRIDQGVASPLGRSNTSAGRVCGIIATVMLIFAGVLVVFAFAAAASHTSSRW